MLSELGHTSPLHHPATTERSCLEPMLFYTILSHMCHSEMPPCKSDVAPATCTGAWSWGGATGATGSCSRCGLGFCKYHRPRNNGGAQGGHNCWCDEGRIKNVWGIMCSHGGSFTKCQFCVSTCMPVCTPTCMPVCAHALPRPVSLPGRWCFAPPPPHPACSRARFLACICFSSECLADVNNV